MIENTLDRPIGLMKSELAVLSDLVSSSNAIKVLEVGMAFGSSTEAILAVLKNREGGHLTSVDPFQLVEPPDGFGGQGLEKVRASGLAHLHELIPATDYLALPDLVRRGRQFDFIFIDGYHSFDYALLDAFFADLLLKPAGMLVLHDSTSAAVFKVCEFIKHNKKYRPIGPPPALIHRNLVRRAARRAYQLASSNRSVFEERRNRWKSLAAFVKESDGMAAEFELRGL